MFVCLFVCLNACFTSDHHNLQSIQSRQTCHTRWINHDIVIDLCFELLMRLSIYIFLGFGKIKQLTWESNLGPSDRELSTLPLDQSANVVLLIFIKYHYGLKKACLFTMGR